MSGWPHWRQVGVLSTTLIVVIVLTLFTCAALGQSSNPAQSWSRADATPGVKLELIETKRRKSNGVTEVEYGVSVTGAPTSKAYTLWILDLGMLTQGLPPAALRAPGEPPIEYRPDEAGNWSPALPRLTFNRYVRGEWIELRMVSTDGAVRALAEAVPFPIQSESAGCTLSLILLSRDGTQFVARGEGFAPDEEVATISRSNGEIIKRRQRVGSDGRLPVTILNPAVKGFLPDHNASYRVEGRNCSVEVEYRWGRKAARKVL